MVSKSNWGDVVRRMTLTRIERLGWTIRIRVTKSEELLRQKENHLEISEAYQREYDRRKKVFNDKEPDFSKGKITSSNFMEDDE